MSALALLEIAVGAVGYAVGPVALQRGLAHLPAVAFVLFFALIGEVGPVRATVIPYVNPAVAAVLGVAILGERFTVGMGVVFALVLAGSVLATRPPRTPERVAEPDVLEAVAS
ncbi:MAG TPA: EamA family transporter [Gaiellaceae bacterium]|nr:EamA family transporter [Gaiellaceae bacterium]